MNISIFFFLVIGISISAHYFFRKKLLLVSFICAVTAAILFQLIGYFVQGYLDPFAVVAFLASVAINFCVSLILGYTLRQGEKK